jgi:excisionase family DNA binding protein
MVQLMTAEEVAEALRLHIKTVHRMADKGELPCTIIGKRKRFLAEDINNIIYKHYRKG